MDKHVFKAGDRVRIINNNVDKDGSPFTGGSIRQDVVGQIVTLRIMSHDIYAAPFWRVVETVCGHNYVFDERAFVLADEPEAPVVKKEAAPVNMTVDALRKKASALKIRNYSRMKKPALLLAVKALVPIEEKEKPPKETLGEKLKKIFGPHSGGVCRYAISYVDNENVYLNDNGACHAAFQAPYDGGLIKEACDNIAYHLDKHVDKEDHEAYKRYVKWILNDSGVKDMFLTKDVNKAFEDAVYYNVEKPTSWVIGSAMLLREMSEFKPRLKTFKWALDNGFSEKIAWALSRFITDGNTFTPQRAMHCVMNVENCDVPSFIAFANEGFRFNKDSIFKRHRGYSIESSAYVRRSISPANPSIGEVVQRDFITTTIGEWGDKKTTITTRNIFKLGEWLTEILA